MKRENVLCPGIKVTSEFVDGKYIDKIFYTCGPELEKEILKASSTMGFIPCIELCKMALREYLFFLENKELHKEPVDKFVRYNIIDSLFQAISIYVDYDPSKENRKGMFDQVISVFSSGPAKCVLAIPYLGLHAGEIVRQVTIKVKLVSGVDISKTFIIGPIRATVDFDYESKVKDLMKNI